MATHENGHGASLELSEKEPVVTVEERAMEEGSGTANEPEGTFSHALAHTTLVVDATASEDETKPAQDPTVDRRQSIGLRTLRLDILYTLPAWLFGWPHVQEEVGPAFHESRIFAACHCILHLVPAGFATYLIYINLRECFIGYTLTFINAPVNDQLAALQFVAKAHELLMLGSLLEIVFRPVRWQLARGRGLPFGAIFAAMNFSFLNTLWSMEYWGAVANIFAANAVAPVLTALSLALITTCCLLAATVGPSSANLMIPRWRDWPAGGTTYYIDATAEQLFPAEIKLTPDLEHCKYRFDDPACPYGGYEIIAESFMSAWSNMLPSLDNTPETTWLPSRQAERAMTFRDRSISQTNSSGMIWANAFSLATANPAAISDGLALNGLLSSYAMKHADVGIKRHWSERDNAVYSVDTRQPIVMVYCNQYVTGDASGGAVGAFANLDSGNAERKTFDGDDDTLHYDNVPITNRTTQSQAGKFVKQSAAPDILWLEDAALRQATGSTLNAIVALPESTLGYSTYYTCSIDSRYANVTLTTATHSPKIINGYVRGMQDWGTYNRSYSKVYPSIQWTDVLNVDFGSGSDDGASNKAFSPFSALVEASGLWSNENKAHGSLATYIVESALASLLANGMARLSYNTSMAGVLKTQWEDDVLPLKQMGWGGDAYNLSPAERAQSAEFVMHATASGYGYSYRGRAQIGAIVVLSTYVLLATATIAHAIMTGQYSSSWNTAAGLAALMANSERLDFLEYTNTGIRSLATFAVPVHIVDVEKHAQLRPVGGGGDVERIEVDESYR